MYEHVSYHKEWAALLKEEIDRDAESKWFHPKGRPQGEEGVGDFDYGLVKFVNRNLNYYYFDNMVSHAVKDDYTFNPAFPMCLEFCKSVRHLLNETGPFGRMCVWNLKPKAYLLPHFDRWEYHYHISRYIFCVSNHEGAEALIRIQGKEIEVKQGLLFKFAPAVEEHEFVNYTDRDWYFIGFDYWKPTMLQEAIDRTKITSETEIWYQEGFGGKKQKYLSPQ